LSFWFIMQCQAKVQRLKTGSIQLREHAPTEKHTGLEAST
jgi:hypothetical protein